MADLDAAMARLAAGIDRLAALTPPPKAGATRATGRFEQHAVPPSGPIPVRWQEVDFIQQSWGVEVRIPSRSWPGEVDRIYIHRDQLRGLPVTLARYTPGVITAGTIELLDGGGRLIYAGEVLR
jgi:hypothetical protein